MTTASESERRSGRRLIFKLGLIGISAVLGLAVAELAVRVIRPASRLIIKPSGFYVADPPGRYRLRPGYRGRMIRPGEFDISVSLNEQGLRGPELEDTGALRLLTIGDSFAFGVGVEEGETFTALLAESLTRSGTPAVGLNAGIPAFGVPDAVDWLERHGLALQPDVVLLSIFLGNDLIDASPEREEILVIDGLLAPKESPRGLKAWLHRHSHLYVLAKSTLEAPAFKSLRTRLGLGEPWTVRVLREEFAIYDQTATGEFEPAIAATNEALARLVALAGQNNFRILTLLVPSEMQIDRNRWQAALEQLDLDPNRHDPEIPRRVFVDLLAKHSIPYTDPSGVLAYRIAEGTTLYFPRDRHWTPEAHEISASELRSLLDRLLSEESDRQPTQR